MFVAWFLGRLQSDKSLTTDFFSLDCSNEQNQSRISQLRTQFEQKIVFNSITREGVQFLDPTLLSAESFRLILERRGGKLCVICGLQGPDQQCQHCTKNWDWHRKCSDNREFPCFVHYLNFWIAYAEMKCLEHCQPQCEDMHKFGHFRFCIRVKQSFFTDIVINLLLAVSQHQMWLRPMHICRPTLKGKYSRSSPISCRVCN